jgi:hypothetical protein
MVTASDSDDFLPPRDGSDNPAAPARGGARRTLFIWIALVIVFFAIYTLLGSGAPPSGDGARASGSELLGTVVRHGWAPILLALFVVWFRVQLRGGEKLAARLEPGLLALANGDAVGAIARFREVEPAYAHQTTYLASVRLHRALAELRAGQLGTALETLRAVERAPGLLFGSDVRTSAALWLTIGFALRGDVERAERWLADVDRRLRRAREGRVAPASLRSLAEALVCLRRDDPAAAARILDRDRARVEESLAVTYARLAWLARAYAAARLAGPRDDAAAAEPWLRLVRGAPSPSFAWVATEWPELRAFMAAHGLV